jgi:hypothetical protein
MTYAVDLSNWTTSVRVPGSAASGGFLEDSLVEDFMKVGLTHASIGTQWPDVAAHQLEVCKRGGMTTEIYSWLSWGRDQRKYIAARDALAQGPYLLQRHAVDVEEKPMGQTPAQLEDETGNAIDEVERQGLVPEIYTARWFWPLYMPKEIPFADVDLWHAEYPFLEGHFPGLAAAPHFDKFIPYGSWHRPRMWQFAGSVTLAQIQEAAGLPVTGRYANLDVNVLEDVPAPGRFGGTMIRFNAVATSKDPTWKWEGQVIEGSGHMDARDDLNLPAEATAIRLDVYLESGRLRILDGDSKAYAGQIGWGEEAEAQNGQVDVLLGKDGRIRFEGAQAKIKTIGVAGYWGPGGITL